ncbi:MAG: methyltransferase domain-containing protein [Nitrospirae bacterium]|nr:methyltransferase domain-containing protein [Nitrospirota bacterium]
MNTIARTLFKIAGTLSSDGKEAYRDDYDLRAEKYDLVETRPILRDGTEKLLAQIDLRPGMRCIDLGCGTGHATQILAERVRPTGNVIGCDFSSGMLCVAKKAADIESSIIHFVHKDMIEFLRESQGNSADFIGAFWSADYCNHKKLLPELYRVLNQNGSVAMLINTQESLKELQKLIVPILVKHPLFIRYFPPINFPPDINHFRKYVIRSGLVAERLEEEVITFNFTSGQTVVKWIKESGPTAGIISALRDHYRDRFFRCVHDNVDRQCGLTITFRFLVFVGRKK